MVGAKEVEFKILSIDEHFHVNEESKICSGMIELE